LFFVLKGKGVITTYWLLGENGNIIDKQGGVTNEE
jgi:hypothetical protein